MADYFPAEGVAVGLAVAEFRLASTAVGDRRYRGSVFAGDTSAATVIIAENVGLYRVVRNAASD